MLAGNERSDDCTAANLLALCLGFVQPSTVSAWAPSEGRLWCWRCAEGEAMGGTAVPIGGLRRAPLPLIATAHGAKGA
eukprot:scaffold395_cov243-Pinguiococcus_pyrenoidosus.AAC.13